VANCFFLSSTFHIFSSHSPNILQYSSTLDQIGIVLVIYSSTLSMVHFTYHYPSTHHLRTLYITISTIFAFVSIVHTIWHSLSTVRSKFTLCIFRNNGKLCKWLSHSLFGLASFLPLFHALTLYSPSQLQSQTSALQFVVLALVNFAGGLVYISRIPERWFPNKFDLWGGSHAVMHVMVMIGAGVWEWGLIRCVRFWSRET
jgi:adiponectin receptor